MKIYPVSNNTNKISYQGSVSHKAIDLLHGIGDKWLNAVDNRGIKNQLIINTFFDNAHRAMNVLENFNIIMERFGHSCKLNFEKSKKSDKYRFFIENEHSNYKLMCGDVELSPEHNKLTDITELEKFEEKLEKLDPYKENTNFIIQRKSNSKNVIHDSEFVPDADYVFLEDKLVGKEPKKEATMEDIEEFLAAAKEEGLV